jgi:hypothetical protein
LPPATVKLAINSHEPFTTGGRMNKVIFDMSMSLDGFVRATSTTPEEPLGKGGERLHEWAMGGDPASGELLATAVSEAGAYICGRRTTTTRCAGGGPTDRQGLPGCRCSS